MRCAGFPMAAIAMIGGGLVLGESVGGTVLHADDRPTAGPVPRPCRIEIREAGSGWPVPLVELRTVHGVRLVSDNAGVVACDLPETMGRETWFDVIGHGYGVPVDGFGNRGVRLVPESGRTLRVEVQRTNIARRIGRLTGSGTFAESQKCGERVDLREPGIVGCDSVQAAVHRDRLWWFWGDTLLAKYPLGIYRATGAATDVRPLKSFEPPLRFAFAPLTDDAGRPRHVAQFPGPGPIWLNGVASLPDRTGTPRLVVTAMRIQPPLTIDQATLCTWNEETRFFEPLKVVWTRTAKDEPRPPMPQGHAVPWEDDAGRKWMLFGDPFPALRCPATFEAWQDPATWERLEPQASVPVAGSESTIRPHSGSIAWNAFRKRWVAVFLQWHGHPSAFGELWYAESDAPTGPWGPAVKVLTHDNYTFYNPRLHPESVPPDSPVLLFEGTYTKMFANHAPATPRYDYNQILYRLDLDDAKLAAAREGAK